MVDKITNKKLLIIDQYKTNYLATDHIRSLAAKIGTNHVTLIPHLTSLKEDRILTVDQQGKNKLYRLNLDDHLTKKYLLLAETVNTINTLEENFLLKRLTATLSEQDMPGSVILFGSYAKKTFDEESDIDLFIIGNPTEKQLQRIRKIGNTYGKTINAKQATRERFTKAHADNEALAKEIQKHHVILNQPEQYIDILWNDAKRRRP